MRQCSHPNDESTYGEDLGNVETITDPKGTNTTAVLVYPRHCFAQVPKAFAGELCRLLHGFRSAGGMQYIWRSSHLLRGVRFRDQVDL